MLSTYTWEKILVAGEVMIPVKYQNEQHVLPAVVVKSPDANLLERDWLREIKLNWNSVFSIQESNPQLKIFVCARGRAGTLKGTQAKIYVDPGGTPKFVKARAVPFALKAKVEEVLDHLQNDGIISPVKSSEWAAPIVLVVKQGSSVCICGDYKWTLNRVSKLDYFYFF